MKLLVSPIDIDEAVIAEKGGADIIDVKNPKEGSLGANFPWVIQAVRARVTKPLSATIGDFNYKPGTASLAALGAAVAGADYVKVGLYDIKTDGQAFEVLSGVVRAVKSLRPQQDRRGVRLLRLPRIGSIPALQLPPVAQRAGCDVVMVDTGMKDGRSTFEFMDNDELQAFVDAAHGNGLQCALAGSIKFDDMPARQEDRRRHHRRPRAGLRRQPQRRHPRRARGEATRQHELIF